MHPIDWPTGAAPLDLDGWRARWPNAIHSRLVQVGDLRWHVQRAGRGPTLLLVHGTAGGTHAWHALLPRLAQRFTVVAPDLPGHAFTSLPPRERLTLDGMASDLAALLRALDVQPEYVAGHSAGAAILLRLALDGALPQARRLIGLNAAVVPPPAMYRVLGGPRLRTLFGGARLARGVARVARRWGLTEALLRSTGSRLGPQQLEWYEALVASPLHVRAALTMMSQWDVPALLRDVHRLTLPTTLLVGTRDRWLPADHVRRVAERLPNARVELLEGHGHLMHEEAGDELAERLLRAIEQAERGESLPALPTHRHVA